MADRISGELNKLNGELLSINDNLSKLTSEVIDLLGSGIVAYTLPERKILILNQEARRMFDAPEIEAGKSNFDVMSRLVPEDRKVVSAAVKKLKQPGDITSFVFHNLKMDGSLATFKCTTKLLSFADNSKYILSSLNDITEQEAFEKRLEEERMRYKAALSIGSFAFFTIDLTDGKLNEPIFTRYGENITEELFNYAIKTVFSEPQLDDLYDHIGEKDDCKVFAVEYLPGQFDQRADSAAQCIQLIAQCERPTVRSAKVFLLYGNVTEEELSVIKNFIINEFCFVFEINIISNGFKNF